MRYTAKSFVHVSIFTTLWMAFVSIARAVVEPPSPEALLPAAIQIGKDLYEGLPSRVQQHLGAQPVLIDTNRVPFVKTVQSTSIPSRQSVVISAGFLTLLNNLSHAKAIDRREAGYFNQYITRLSARIDGTAPELPNRSNPAYWTLDVVNERDGYFNQAVAGVVSVELSQHALANEEWERSLWTGIQNALECGYGTEGLQMLYNVIERLPVRPAWAARLLPCNVQVSRMKHLLAKQEHVFFHGK